MEYTGRKPQPKLSIEDVFLSIDDMILYNFDMYRKTNDNNWFLKTYTGKEKKLDHHLIKPFEEKINDEYYKATNDQAFQTFIQRLAKIDNLQTKYTVVSALVERMRLGFGASVDQQRIRYMMVQQIKDWKYKMPYHNFATPAEDFEQLNNVAAQLPGIKTAIALINDELQKEGSKQTLSLYKQLVIISSALQLGYEIDSRKITVRKWLDLGELMREKAKKN